MVEHQPPQEAYEPNEPRASARADSHTPSVTTSEQPAENENTAPDIERFFCIYCGYDLTGHSGDARRCPECGNVTTAALLQAALLVQRRSLRSLEPATIPSLLFWIVVFAGATSLGTEQLWAQVLCALSVAAWVWSIARYLTRYGHHYDCWWFLLESHIVRLVLPVAALVLIVSGLFLVMAGPRRQVVAGPRWQVVAVPVISVITLSIAWTGYRDLKRRLPAYKLPKPPETNANFSSSDLLLSSYRVLNQERSSEVSR